MCLVRYASLVMIIAESVDAAMASGDLTVRYLPTISLAGGVCVGAEALVHWQRGEQILTGADFIPLIENTPLSGKLTYSIVDTVADELGPWLDSHPEAHISINVPPEILGRGGLDYAAGRSGLKTREAQIILEITERGIPDRLGLEALNAMAQRGIRLALDDTLLSGVNVALLTRCNFSLVKLDRSLIAQIIPGQPEPNWLSNLASLLETSSLQVVAEGVEHEYQIGVLMRAGVQLAQGYFFSHGVPARELAALYEHKRWA